MDSMEVDSPFLDQTHINVDGTHSAINMVRHKQVTAEWRKMVRPIMWLCQWLELRMKDLLSQVAKYDKELDVINHEKDLQLEMIKGDGPKSESARLDSQCDKRNIMRRRQRKRDEEATDTSLYMRKHPTLSYYENKKSGVETDGNLVNGGFDSLVVEDIKSSLGQDDALVKSNGNGRVFEQYSLREILFKVDDIQSRILRLQGFLCNARSKCEKLSHCLHHRQVEVPKKNQKAQNHLASFKKDGKCSLKKTKVLPSLLQKEDINKPLVAVPPALPDRSADCMLGYMKRNNVQEGTTRSDANGITFEMLFGADSLLTNAYVAEFCKECVDDVLIENQAAKEGYQQFEKVKHAAEEHSELVKKFGKTPPSQGEQTIVHIVKCEQVQETAQITKQIISGNKQGQKPKKLGSSLPALKDESEKSLHPPAKKNKTEKDPNNLKNEKPVLVVVDPRRSQRVENPKFTEASDFQPSWLLLHQSIFVFCPNL